MSDELKLELLRRVGDLPEGGELSSREYCAEKGWKHEVFLGLLRSLEVRAMLKSRVDKGQRWRIAPAGRKVMAEGSPEFLLYQQLEQPTLESDLKKQFGGGGWKALSSAASKLIQVNKKVKPIMVQRKEGIVVEGDQVKAQLEDMQIVDEEGFFSLESVERAGAQDKNRLNTWKKRKFAAYASYATYFVFKGERFALQLPREANDLTHDLLQDNQWKDVEFKAYNFSRGVSGLPPLGGHLHTLLKERALYRQVFLEMGFSEMPTNRFVESSFWNFDSLFQPQQHPARDAHDTFFLTQPTHAVQRPPQDYFERVQQTHTHGGYGSIGWRYDWSAEEAMKNVLRTHTTAVSARTLYELAQQETFTPKKMFSIDRVFRNETLDKTHLAEFHQIEGWIADYDLTLGHLMGIIREFFKRLGITRIQFKPAYNPYTEPSMEIFAFHEHHKKWIEIGNSGMFRPEMLRPMGLPENVRVIAWGCGLERPVMIKYGYTSVRDLMGHGVDIGRIQSNPFPRD